MSTKRMLIIGPGFGHNINAKINSLSQCKEFEVSFWADSLDTTFKENYAYIHYIEPQIILRKKRPFRSIITFINALLILRKYDYDVLYSLGMGGPLTAFMFFISKKKTIRAIELYSNHIIWNARRNKSFKDRMDRYVVDKADYFCQYWWGIREQFKESFPQYEDKFLLYQLYYSDALFSDEHHTPTSDFTINFLKRIPKEQKVCFWPRSFIPSNNHKLLLDSLGLIKKERPDLMEHFKLYLWGGNVERPLSRKIINDSIKDNILDKNVEIVEHPFVSRNDIFAIEERSDFFVQIANDDILSLYIMEMICSRKPFILSNLRTFQFLNEKYDLKIDLVENKKRIIADRIIEILLGNIDYTELEWRKRRCSQIFSQSNVIPWYTALYDAITK